MNFVVGVGDALAANKNSFLAGCRVVDLWKMSKLKQLDVATLQEMMKPAVADFLQKHIAVYGVRCVRPKHHWLFDVIITALRNGTSLDMFILERLHLRVKPEGELMRNTWLDRHLLVRNVGASRVFQTKLRPVGSSSLAGYGFFSESIVVVFTQDARPSLGA